MLFRSVDFRDAAAHRAIAPDISFEALDRAMHIKLPGGKTYKGFYAFRQLTHHLPVLWIFASFLYIPGIPTIGRKVYAHIAARRKKCTHEDCGI